MLIAHIVFRFDYGGLENGVVNVINGLSDGPLVHTVIALTEATEFSNRLRTGVAVHSIGKKPGKDFGAYVRLYRLLRDLKPDIVHTRNMGTMDCLLVAFIAGVPIRIHGEHGWDIFDPDGKNPKYRFMRRFLQRFAQQIVTVSDDLRTWLINVVGVKASKVQHICNGVDTETFQPAQAKNNRSTDSVRIGSVTRFSAIKDPLNLVEAFIALRKGDAVCNASFDLAMIGDGELHGAAVQKLQDAGLEAEAWLPGSRDDIPDQLRDMDIFVLGSLREGISNTVLEAMSSGLPVIASNTGGNPELIEDGKTGALVTPGDRQALADAIAAYVADPDRRIRHGRAARERVLSLFSIRTMVSAYELLYMRALGLRES
jgi:sugar transferase (PEP-CTERM/EpsH1 system associated)